MSLGSLTFIGRTRGATAEDIQQGVRIRGEVEWIVSGLEQEVRALERAVGPDHADAVSPDTLLLRFGNSVGRFLLPGLGDLIVCCGKWDDEAFDALLSALTEVALALPYAADQSAGLPHDRTLVKSNAILLHAFLYARHVVLSAKREEGVAASMAAILREPHRRFQVERERAPLAAARTFDSRSIARIVSAVDPMVRAPAKNRNSSLARALRGHLPCDVDVPRAFHSLDTAENRFVLAFLEQVAEVVERVETIARTRTGPFWSRVVRDCREMESVVRPILGHGIWEGVGRSVHLPMASTVLQRRRGYREIFRHHLLMRAAARLPLDDNLTQLLGLKDVAALYELWCFFAVTRALQQVLGRPATLAERPRLDDVQLAVPWGLRVSWGDALAVFYNLTFSQAHSGARRSDSLQLRPDIAICVRTHDAEQVHVLDAKLRIAWAGLARDSETDDPKSFMWSDVGKMHTYRDALPAVRTAFVLYPGDDAARFEIAGSKPGAVGAIPLAPDGPLDALVEHLERIVCHAS